MALIVEKFGGSSLANLEKMRNAASIIAGDYKRENDIVVVVSAQGDTTDELLEKAGQITQRPAPREMDVLLSTGEQMSIALMAMTLQQLGAPAISLCGWQAGMHTDESFGGARIQKVDTARVRRELDSGKIVVVAGFQGLTPQGDITTIGRGGSDTTAVALAAALKADVCRIYTDVDGVYSADPRLVKGAIKHYEIGYDEMLELASLGAQVLHNRSVEMAKRFSVPMEVLSSFQRHTGTKVREVMMEQKNVTGVAQDASIAIIRIDGLEDRPGNIFRLFSVLAREKINIDMIVQSTDEKKADSLIFSVPRSAVPAAVETLAQNQELLGFSNFSVDEQVSKLSIVGAGMVTSCGVAAKMFEALYDAGINIRHVTTSEIKISVIVDKADAQRALEAVHNMFF